MKRMVLTAACWPSAEEAHRKLWIFIASCEKFGITPYFYGIGTPHFAGYRQMCLDMQLEYLKTVGQSYSHVLFTDSWDAFFTAPLDEIIAKYEAMGSPPILMSAYLGLGNESDMSKYEGCFDETKLYRYPNRGGYIAEIPAIISAFERMLAQPGLTGDDCFEYYRGWREGWFRPALDSECQIFQVTDENCEVGREHGPERERIEVDGMRFARLTPHLRLYNRATDSYPCILHLSGGYSSQESGKDDRMIPWARRLGIIA